MQSERNPEYCFSCTPAVLTQLTRENSELQAKLDAVMQEGLAIKVSELMTELAQAEAKCAEMNGKLETILSTQPAHDGGGGLFRPHYDGEGNEIGTENIDPVALLGHVYGMVQDALSPDCGKPLLVRVKRLEQALIAWRDYFQSDWPKNADQQEQQVEDLTKAWTQMEQALAETEGE